MCHPGASPVFHVPTILSNQQSFLFARNSNLKQVYHCLVLQVSCSGASPVPPAHALSLHTNLQSPFSAEKTAPAAVHHPLGSRLNAARRDARGGATGGAGRGLAQTKGDYPIHVDGPHVDVGDCFAEAAGDAGCSFAEICRIHRSDAVGGLRDDPRVPHPARVRSNGVHRGLSRVVDVGKDDEVDLCSVDLGGCQGSGDKILHLVVPLFPGMQVVKVLQEEDFASCGETDPGAKVVLGFSEKPGKLGRSLARRVGRIHQRREASVCLIGHRGGNVGLRATFYDHAVDRPGLVLDLNVTLEGGHFKRWCGFEDLACNLPLGLVTVDWNVWEIEYGECRAE